jgi:hypothetical protein
MDIAKQRVVIPKRSEGSAFYVLKVDTAAREEPKKRRV